MGCGLSVDRSCYSGSSQPKLNANKHKRSKEYVTINGRIYVNNPDSVYYMPCDEQEMDRLDDEHYMYWQTFGSNVVAPVRKMRRCIDLGSGSGIWIMEMAKEHPKCEFFGLDLVLPQVSELNPPNVHFIKGNFLQELPFSDNLFDYVHHRCLATSIPASEWQGYIHQCARICAYDGWVEIIECNSMLWNVAKHGERFNTWLHQLAAPLGVNLFMIDRIGDMMRKAGLTNIQSCQYTIPVGSWGGSRGEQGWRSISTLLITMTPFLQHYVGASSNDVLSLLDDLRSEVNRCRSHIQVKVYWARKRGA